MKKQQLSKILSNIYVSSPSDVRSKLRPIIGNDPYKIVNAYANYISYEKLKDKDLADMILEAKILDDELLKLLQSLSNIKATSNTLSKNDFINLFYTTLENLGYGMYI